MSPRLKLNYPTETHGCSSETSSGLTDAQDAPAHVRPQNSSPAVSPLFGWQGNYRISLQKIHRRSEVSGVFKIVLIENRSLFGTITFKPLSSEDYVRRAVSTSCSCLECPCSGREETGPEEHLISLESLRRLETWVFFSSSSSWFLSSISWLYLRSLKQTCNRPAQYF